MQILHTPDDILVEFPRTQHTIAENEAKQNPFFGKMRDWWRQHASLVVPAKCPMFPPYDVAAADDRPQKSNQEGAAAHHPGTPGMVSG
ncbi:MAG TPA: hypothetical protein VF194_16925 [Ferrovibrio sp.]